MKKILALFAVAALAVPALADNELTVTDAVLGDIENTSKVVTGVSIDLSEYAKKADAYDDTAVKARLSGLEGKTNDWNTAATKAGSAVQTVAKASGAATELTVTQSGDAVTVGLDLSAYAKTADLPEETDPVWSADKAKYVQFTDAAFTTATNKAATAVQSVSKAAGGATELTVTQNGTAVTIDVDLSAYAKTADAYVHPTYTAYASGLYKVTVSEEGHVTAAVAVQKSDITALGIPAQDTVYDDTALAGRVTTIEGKESGWDTAATTAAANAALLADIAAVSTDDISTLNECIAAIKAIVAAAQ